MDNTQLILAAYNLLLGREPDAGGMLFWGNKLKSGMDKNQFLYSITSSDEFKRNPPKWLDLGLWQKCKNVNAEVCLNLPIGKFCGPATDDSVFAAILQLDGQYEPHVAAQIKKHLKKGNTFVDIGANLGYFTLLASRLVGPFGKVISFEPATKTYNFCRKNIDLNKLTNVELHKNGLWSYPKDLKISVMDQLGGNHISDEGDSIRCIALDSLNLRPDLIKMDIEGAEPYALEGMQTTLKRYHPAILIEVNRWCLKTFFGKDSNDIWSLLTDLGYKIKISTNGRQIDSLDELNSLCPVDGLIDILAE